MNIEWPNNDEKRPDEGKSVQDRLVMRGNWIAAEDKLPPPETPVLAFVHGIDIPIVLEMRWETCNQMVESYFEDFLYWDNPHDDGQNYEDRVFAWQPLPEDP